MSKPDPKDLYVDDFLSNVLLSYVQSEDNYIAGKMFPVVDVEKESGLFPKFDRDDFLADEAEVRGDHSESAGSGWDVDKTVGYDCKQISHHKDLGQRAKTNAANVMDLERSSTRFVGQKLLMKRDVLWAERFFKTGTWPTEKTGVAVGPGANQFLQWDATGAEPYKDMLAYLEEIAGLTGFRPNRGAVDPLSWNVLREHPDTLDKIKHTRTGVGTPALVAEALELESFQVIRSVTKAKGAATPAFIAPKGALFAYATDTPSTETPSAGYIASWVGLLGPAAFSGRITRLEMPWRNHTTRIEGDLAQDPVQTAADLAVFMNSTIA
jgi:hypothetical protein